MAHKKFSFIVLLEYREPQQSFCAIWLCSFATMTWEKEITSKSLEFSWNNIILEAVQIWKLSKEYLSKIKNL